MRKCSRCKQCKPIEQYHSGGQKVYNYCKACTKEYMLEYYKRNKEKIKVNGLCYDAES